MWLFMINLLNSVINPDFEKLIIWQQVIHTGDSIMIGHEKGIFEWLSVSHLSQAKMRRCSPLCETHSCIKDKLHGVRNNSLHTVHTLFFFIYYTEYIMCKITNRTSVRAFPPLSCSVPITIQHREFRQTGFRA